MHSLPCHSYPGPLAVSGALGANIGFFILYSIIISLAASAVGGWFYGNFLTKKYGNLDGAADVSDDDAIAEITQNTRAVHPSAAAAIFLILLPIILILISTVLPYLSQASAILNVCTFLSASNGVGALTVSVITAWLMLRKYIDRTAAKIFSSSLNDVGDIFFILAASGAYGAVISASGIGSIISSFISSTGIPLFVMAFILSVLLKAALGSSATALVTTASLIAPMMNAAASPVIVGLAICLGGLGVCLPTDGAFWQVKEYNNLSMKDTFIAHTGGNLIACIVGFTVLCILSACAGFLPGLA